MYEFQLFKISIFLPQQQVLSGPKSRPEIIYETIKSSPQAELRKGRTWHIGNIIRIDEDSIYLRVGRVTKENVGIYKDGNFIEVESEKAPYTHVFVDTKIEVCAVAKKPQLSPTTKGVANKLITLCNNSETARYLNVKFNIDMLNDPKGFIYHIKKAYSISKFWMSFKKPNPFDVNKDFHEPFSKFLLATNGDKGKAEIRGEDLSSDILEDLAHSAATTGDDAAARIKIEEKEKPTTMHLKNNPVYSRQKDIGNKSNKRDFINKVRKAYTKLRGKTKNESQ